LTALLGYLNSEQPAPIIFDGEKGIFYVSPSQREEIILK
jgi:hypothetical protein